MAKLIDINLESANGQKEYAEFTALLNSFKSAKPQKVQLEITLKDEVTKQLQKNLDGLDVDELGKKLDSIFKESIESISQMAKKLNEGYKPNKSDIEKLYRDAGRVIDKSKNPSNIQEIIDYAYKRRQSSLGDWKSQEYYNSIMRENVELLKQENARFQEMSTSAKEIEGLIQSQETVREKAQSVVGAIEEEQKAVTALGKEFSNAASAYAEFLKACLSGNTDATTMAMRNLADATAVVTGDIDALSELGNIFSGVKPTEAYTSQIKESSEEVERLLARIKELEDESESLRFDRDSADRASYGEFEQRIEAEIKLENLQSEHRQTLNELALAQERLQNYMDDFYRSESKLDDVEEALIEKEVELARAQEALANSRKVLSSGSGNGGGPEGPWLDILEQIRDTLIDISKSIGTVSDEESGVNNLIKQFERLDGVLDEIQKKVGTGVFNVVMNTAGNDVEKINDKIDEAYTAELARVKKAYEKLMTRKDKNGNDYDIIAALYQNKYAKREASLDSVRQMYSTAKLSEGSVENQVRQFHAFFDDVSQLTKSIQSEIANLEKIAKSANVSEQSAQNIKEQIADRKYLLQMIGKPGIGTFKSFEKRTNKIRNAADSEAQAEAEKLFNEEVAKSNGELEEEETNLKDILIVLDEIVEALEIISSKDFASELNESIEKLNNSLLSILATLKEMNVVIETTGTSNSISKLDEKIKETAKDIKVIDEIPLIDENEVSKAISLVERYKNQLGKVADIYKQTVVNSEGSKSTAYRMVGESGNTVTVDSMGNLLRSTEKVDNALTKQREEVKELNREFDNLSRGAQLRYLEQKLKGSKELTEEFADRVNKLKGYLAEAGTDKTELYQYDAMVKELNKDIQTTTLRMQQEAKAAKQAEKNLTAQLNEQTKAEQGARKQALEERDATASRLVKEQVDAWKKIWDLKKKIASLQASDGLHSSEISLYESQVKEQYDIVHQKTEELKLNNMLAASSASIIEMEEVRKNALEEINVIQSRTVDAMENTSKGWLDELKSIKSAGGWTKSYIDELDRASNELREFQKEISSLSFDEAKNKFESLRDIIERTIGDKALKSNKAPLETQLTNLQRKISQIVAKNSAMGSEFQKRWDNLKIRLDNAQSMQALSEIAAEVNKLQAEMNAAGKTGQRFIDLFSQRLKSLNATFLSKYLSFYDIIRYTKNAVSEIRKLDDALVDLKKTAKMSGEELEQFYFDANSVAKTMGATTEEIINQAAAWSRLGYSTNEEATAMAALSSQFAAISPDMDLEKATDGLVSTMKAFHIETSEVESSMMDAVNRIGNTMATSNEEIVDMLTRSSAAMSAANNTLAETIALESAAVQITRNAETTGTAFRTISMRIRGKHLCLHMSKDVCYAARKTA